MDRFSPTQRIGVNEVTGIFLKEFKWIPRTILESDMGIDMEVEICDNGNPTGQLVGIQIKTGESYFKENIAGDIIYRGSNVHLKYWLNHSLPILIILHNPTTGVTLWQEIVQEKISVTKSRWKIEIPISKQLTGNCKDEIINLNKFPLYFQRVQRLSVHKELMMEIKRGNKIIIEADEWVNKSIGRVTISLKRINSNGKEILLSEGGYIHFNGIDSLQILYPWADFHTDEEYYYDYDHDNFMEHYGIWDSENKVYCGEVIDFSEYKSSLPSIRAMQDGSGEKQLYRLELTLNALGNSFLEVNKYLEFNQQLKLKF